MWRCLRRAVFVTAILTKMMRIWHDAGGMEAMKGATTWPIALDWILFPYLGNNGHLKP